MKPDRSIPNGIFVILAQLPSYDLRVGQFFECLRSFCEQQGKDIFVLENSELLDIMVEWMKNSIPKT